VDAYLKRKETEGKTRTEAMRCLKRHLARHYHRLLMIPPAVGCRGLDKAPRTRSAMMVRE
jgi:hypothetical protein